MVGDDLSDSVVMVTGSVLSLFFLDVALWPPVETRAEYTLVIDGHNILLLVGLGLLLVSLLKCLVDFLGVIKYIVRI